jgi:ER membrane protein complex subunit 1
MHLNVLAALAGLLALSARALHQSDVGITDWHKNFIGVPRITTLSTAPTFHRILNSAPTTKSVLLTATDSGVLAALNPVDGSLGSRFLSSFVRFFLLF